MKIDNLKLPIDRTLYLSSQVNQDSMNKLTTDIIEINESDEYLKKLYALHELEYNPKPIKIYIDSYGGMVYQCLGLLSVMEKSVTPIHTIVTGCAMSCGFMIAICGHKRFAYKLSTLLYHQVSSVAWGKLKEMKEDLKETQRLQDIIEKITLKQTKIPAERLKKSFKQKEDWFIPAEEALKLGCIDKII